MTTRQTTETAPSEREAQLQAFFDGELDEAGIARVEAALEEDPALAGELEDLRFMRHTLRGELEQQSAAIPEARFEQIWDRFDAELEREARLQASADEGPSLWTRIVAFVQPVRIPIAVGAVAALALVLVRSGGGDEGAAVADRGAPEVSEPSPDLAPAVPDVEPEPAVRVADADAGAQPSEGELEVFPIPETNDAEVERIEFGGRSGTISHVAGEHGTTTVIWVTEDDEPVDSERSL